MFCSHCGKTVKPEDVTCPSCGMPIGDSRFARGAYTAAQSTAAADTPRADQAPYTKITYMSQPPEDEGVYARTNYRPTLDDAEVIAEDDEAQGEAAGEEFPPEPPTVLRIPQQDADETDSLEPKPATPAVSVGAGKRPPEPKPETPEKAEKTEPGAQRVELKKIKRTGISPQVRQYMQKSDDRTQRRTARPAGDAGASGYAEDGSREADDGYERQEGLSQIVRRKPVIITASAVMAVIILIVGIIWIRSLTEVASKIPGVTNALNTGGVTLIRSFAKPDYRAESADLFDKKDDAGNSLLTKRQEEETGKIDALLPVESPGENDQLFIDALHVIHKAMMTATILDVAALANPESPTHASVSQNAWNIIETSIGKLESATGIDILNSIKNTTVVTASTPTPAPTMGTVENRYVRLMKGMSNSDDVRALQERLGQLGFLSDIPDGIFGSKTETAVKRFQNIAGLPVDGIATPELQELLFSSDAPTPPPPATPSPTPEPTPSPTPDIPAATTNGNTDSA